MNVKRIMSAAALVALLAAAAEAKEHVSPEELARRKAEMLAEFEKRTGGRIEKPGSRQGEIVYANCQKRVPR